MYAIPQNGQVAAGTDTPTLHLGTYRRNILAVVVDNELFTPAEQLRCNDAVHQCACPRKLALWLTNVRRVAGEREEERQVASFSQAVERGRVLIAQPVRYATPAQCDELYRLACHPALSAADKTQTLLLLPAFTESEAATYLGKLRAKVLRHTSQGSWQVGSTVAQA